MIRNRMIPFALVAAVLVTLSLTGFPWHASPLLGNFHGQVVYTPDEMSLDLSGHFNLYNCPEQPGTVVLKVIMGDREYEVDATRPDGSFGRLLKIDRALPDTVEARLEVDGRVVAVGTIALPPGTRPGIHIIRFSSLT